MHKEIERKFLVKGDYIPYIYMSHHIVQGYLCKGQGRTVRVRIRDEQGFLTIKGPSENGGLSRFEWEQEISLADAQSLLSLCEEGVIDKHRHLIRAGELIYEVDEFHGDNDGLLVAEIELPTEDAPFERPDWLGEEVTGDKRYYNSHLLAYPYKAWKN